MKKKKTTNIFFPSKMKHSFCLPQDDRSHSDLWSDELFPWFQKDFVMIFSLQWFISCSCFFKYFLLSFFFYSTNSGPWILSLCGTLISVYTRQSVHLVTTFLVRYYCSLWVYSNTTAMSNAWVDPSEQSALGTRSITSERNEVLLLLIRLVHNLS